MKNRWPPSNSFISASGRWFSIASARAVGAMSSYLPPQISVGAVMVGRMSQAS